MSQYKRIEIACQRFPTLEKIKTHTDLDNFIWNFPDDIENIQKFKNDDVVQLRLKELLFIATYKKKENIITPLFDKWLDKVFPIWNHM